MDLKPTEFYSHATEMPSLIFGDLWSSKRAYVYLHGLGEFGKGVEGQYEYPGFATALRDDEVHPRHPMVLPCGRKQGRWTPDTVRNFLGDLPREFGDLDLDLIGYSAGGTGVYDYIAQYSDVRTATVINARLPTNQQFKTRVPLQVIVSREDHLETVASVRTFCNRLWSAGIHVTFEERDGDHFIIHPVALDAEFYRWIEDAPNSLNDGHIA
jgi:pimeloyl-ACP methyl ester carboxylesterase